MLSLTAYKLALAAAFVLAPLSGVSARSLNSLFSRAVSGINCDGSSQCKGYKGDLSTIKDRVNKIAIGTTYKSGEQLACAGFDTVPNDYGVEFSKGDGICVSVGHNTPSFSVDASTNGQSNSAGDIMEDLLYYGCDPCGTAPTVRQGNQLSGGSLSVNYVKSVCYSWDNNPCNRN